MNLSKTEKLLAAKKKLREFQLSKMQNNQDVPTKQKHSMDLSSPQCQDAKTSKSNLEIMNNIVTIENSTNASQNNVHTTHQDFQQSETVSMAPVSIIENTNHEESQNSIEDTVQDVQRINSSLETEKKQVDLADFPKVQKDHLLDMASAVADVLTNESDNVETSLDSDLVCRNQFLTSYLEEQKKTINELHIELSSARSRILDLETKLKGREAEYEAQLAREVNPLKEQLHLHTQTTGILIAEKAELTAALNQAQQAIRQNSEGAEEMMGKLKNSQMYVAELEKEVSNVKNYNEELKKNFHLLQSDYDTLDKKYFELKKEREDLHLEVSELKQKLNLKKTEFIAVQQELQEKTALLSLSELRIQQMRGATPTEEEKHASILTEQELAQTKESLKAVTAERDEASRQYQNYVKQLDAQQTKLLEEMKAQKKTIQDLQQREGDYVRALSELEQQLQQEREKVENLSPLQDRKEQILTKMDTLLKNIDELTLEQEKLHITLSEKDTQIEMLTKELNDLRETSNQEAEVTKLASALESEQLGASRAIHQNRQLKDQLTDMENAFVSLSNDKLDLTEQLQAERSIGRKLNVQLNNTESELQQLRETLREKEALLEELEKERLQSAQIADQMQHYQAQSHHANTFQRELQKALVTIERLEKEKQELTVQLRERSRDNSVTEIDSLSPNADGNILNSKEDAHVENLNEDNILVSEPVKQLERRFKETMERVAELTEEKQKLEHLVLQLQSETETIGEYITLYQKQRAILQNRAIERDQVFRQLLDQRNQQQEQLHKLKVLVSDFLRREYIHSNGAEHLVETALDANDLTLSKSKKEEIEPPMENKSVSELLDVLTEIKDCKDSCMFEPNFHPCPWCSGKLLTV
ncbi:golgin subfamily A member 2-like [Ceratina calcarata]|uniref:Golgin subfamily A member 2-like n=1 Tax=Ceratina calcarata TaxID=156304 RepID=A0AAJ7J398_9HYME|nr:golgin subfamily A member 2-like [Ceratina calcarata]